jgi:hypothetical protein
MILILYFTANIALVLAAHIYGTLTDDKDMIIKGKKRWLFNIIGLLIAFPLVTYILIYKALTVPLLKTYLNLIYKERESLEKIIALSNEYIADYGKEEDVVNNIERATKRLDKLDEEERLVKQKIDKLNIEL